MEAKREGGLLNGWLVATEGVVADLLAGGRGVDKRICVA